MKTQLKKIFPDPTSLSTSQSKDTIKVCDTNETHLAPHHQDSLDTFYSCGRSSYPQSCPAYCPQWHQPRPPSYFNHAQGQNPHNEKGEITHCSYCHSINHYQKDCPDEHLYASGSFSRRYQPPYQPSPTTPPVCKTYLQEEETSSLMTKTHSTKSCYSKLTTA